MEGCGVDGGDKSTEAWRRGAFIPILFIYACYFIDEGEVWRNGEVRIGDDKRGE